MHRHIPPNTHAHIHIAKSTYIQTCMHTQNKNSHKYLCTLLIICTHLHTHNNLHDHVHTCMYIHICTHRSSHTCIYSQNTNMNRPRSYTFSYTCVFVYTCPHIIHTLTCTLADTHNLTHTDRHTHMYTLMHSPTHT